MECSQLMGNGPYRANAPVAQRKARHRARTANAVQTESTDPAKSNPALSAKAWRIFRYPPSPASAFAEFGSLGKQEHLSAATPRLRHFHPNPRNLEAAVSLLPGKANELDQLWDTKASFRQLCRRLAVVWGIGALIGCALNLFYAIALPVDVVPALDSATQIAVFVLLQVLTQIAVHREGSLAQLWGRRQS